MAIFSLTRSANRSLILPCCLAGLLAFIVGCGSSDSSDDDGEGGATGGRNSGAGGWQMRAAGGRVPGAESGGFINNRGGAVGVGGDNGGGAENGGAAGAENGGTAGAEDGGTAGLDTGGVAGLETGGVAGLETGGVAGLETGGVAGLETGGVAGLETGGVAGLETGGVAGLETGGVAGLETGGVAGEQSGGAAGAGTGVGGDTGVGGAAAGASNEGGNQGVGGTPAEERTFDVYVGCADADGTIQYLTVNSTTGMASYVSAVTTGVPNAACGTNDDGTLFYVANNDSVPSTIATVERTTAGASSGRLTVVGTATVPPDDTSAGPRSVSLDDTGDFALVATTGTDSVDVFAVNPDGSLGDVVDSRTSTLLRDPYQAVVVPGSQNQLVVVAYHGSDLVAVYPLGADGVLEAGVTVNMDSDTTGGNTGPRQVVFHPEIAGLVYVINEVSGTITRLYVHTTTGAMALRESVSAVPDAYTGAGKLTTQGIISPSGDFLYVLNRYTNTSTSAAGSIVVFAIDPATGELSQVSWVSTEGAVPMNMALSADGGTLVVANQNSDQIAMFAVDRSTGGLSYLRSRDVCSAPTFVEMIEQ